MGHTVPERKEPIMAGKHASTQHACWLRQQLSSHGKQEIGSKETKCKMSESFEMTKTALTDMRPPAHI